MKPTAKPDAGNLHVHQGGSLRVAARTSHHGRWCVALMTRNASLLCSRLEMSRPTPHAQEEILHALRADDGMTMKRLLQEGLDPLTTVTASADRTLIHHAARGNRIAVLTALLDDPRSRRNRDGSGTGADIALKNAVYGQAVEAARVALAAGADPGSRSRYGWPSLAYMVRCGHIQLVNLLLLHPAPTGVDAEGVSPLDRLGPLPQAKTIVEAFRSRGHPISAQAEVYAGNRTKALEILADPAKRQTQGAGALAAAVLTDDVDLVKRILDLGVPVDVVDPNWGMTGLQLAVGVTADPLVVELLLERKSDPDAPGRRGSARQLAAGNGYPLPGQSAVSSEPKLSVRTGDDGF